MTSVNAKHEALLDELLRDYTSPQDIPHSTEFSGGTCHCSSKASRGKDLEVEEPVSCWDFASFHFHPPLAGMLSPTLIGHQVV